MRPSDRKRLTALEATVVTDGEWVWPRILLPPGPDGELPEPQWVAKGSHRIRIPDHDDRAPTEDQLREASREAE
jgi:hypothetical protein